MGLGGPFGKNSRTPRNHALHKLIYDEAQKKSGNNGPGTTGCALWFLLIIVGLIIVIFGRG